MPTSEAPRSTTSRVPLTIALVAAVLVVGGGWLVWHSRRVGSFGWFAYAPLSETVYSPGLGTSAWVGVGLLVVGLLTLGGVGGYVLGRRR
ncbi:MAG TPA: hypothetical protein VNR62_09115 [Cellulomonas sp.]|nr:hypothetical protein [Cellulomonas sp.]